MQRINNLVLIFQKVHHSMSLPMAALRAAAMATPPPTNQYPSTSTPKLKLAPFTTLTTALTLLPPPSPAHSLSKDQLISSLTDVENAFNGAVDLGAGAVTILRRVFDAVRPGVDAAVPVVKQAGSKALELASPILAGASKQAQDSLQSAGIDPSPALNAAKTVVDVVQQAPKVVESAKPIASATVETIASSDPQTIALASGAAVLSYFLLPPLVSVIAYNLRGYKGDLTPAQALDRLCTQNYLLIDIRSEKDKNKAGIPRLPSSAKNKIISVPLEDLPSKLKGLVKSVKTVEAEMAALKISYLKRLNKASNIVILDSYCDSAKTVAKTLTSLGFKNTWTVSDGFSGGRGWLQSRLGTDSYNFAVPEIVSPSRIIPTSAGRAGTSVQPAQRLLLPGSGD